MAPRPSPTGPPDFAGPAAGRAIGYAWFTIGYNVVEFAIAVVAGLAASSIALLGFGADSGIEVFSAAIVLARLLVERDGRAPDLAKERLALRAIAVTFGLLALSLIVRGAAALVSGADPERSPAGIAITAASLVVMPWLARAKRTAGEQMGSPLVVADAAQTRFCAWLSLSTLLSLVGFWLLGWTWLDPVGGLVIAAFAVSEAREAWEGELAEDRDG